ncbi:hypothetical protein HG536_0D03600 [Torulaspora globosa]|uniref:Anoctamin transmembrane domain-containing protein n=1 Tax=Torulaspora globosa TaxID=48254 RepID=A0A7G3ZH52_9SACH|nr:uncharacterized protein HG536_0D03600 [Torulaspora globosa]QLL32838.1 hypothetical protein HG536_0D03600 [Torulaspora globosa]
MSESFQQLDPNYVIAFQFSADNLTQLLTELGAKGLHVLPRPGHDKDTVYAFTRVEDGNVQEDVNENGKTHIETNEETGEEKLYKICQPLNFVKSITRIHDFETRKKLDKTSSSLIGKPFGLPSDQELVQLERLTKNARQALYFAFVKSYIIWLIPLSVVGVVSKLLRTSTPWEFNIPYTAFLVIWSLLFASSWVYRSEPFYSSKFGKVRSFSEASERHLSTAPAVLCKKLCFLPVAVLFVLSLVSFQFFCFFVEIFVTQFYAGPLGSIMALIPTVMICSFIPILTIVYNKIFVDRLVKWENGPNPLRSKVEKNFILTFFTSYVPLVITLFIYLPLGYKITPEIRAVIAEWSYRLHIPITENDFVLDVKRYRNQFFYFTVTNQVIAFSLENILPLFQRKAIQFVMSKLKKDEKDHESIIVSTVKSYFPGELPIWQKVKSYHVSDFGEFDVDENFKKIIIQFGYISMFSTIWPLAPLISLLFSYVMFKADLWRALKKCRPSTNPNDVVVSENNYNATFVSANPWDSVLSTISWIGATAAPTLLIMYRYSGLPGVGLENALNKRDLWYRCSPLPYSTTTILIIAVISEHLAVLSFAYFRKLFIASGQKVARGFVPATDLQEPPPIDLSSLVRQTNSFMNAISDKIATSKPEENKSRNGLKTFDNSAETKSSIARNTGESQFLARKLSSNHQTSSAQEKSSSGVIPAAVVTRAAGSERQAHPVSQPKNLLSVAPKTPSAKITAGVNDQKESRDHSAIAANGVPAPSSAEEVWEKTISSQNRSNLESGSIAAGATLPATIPTSKNYHLRYNSDGKPVTPSGSPGTSESSLPSTRPEGQRSEQEKMEAAPGVTNNVTKPRKESRLINDIETQKTLATEARSLDPAKVLNTIPHNVRDDHLAQKDGDTSLAASAAAAALTSHSRTPSQMNAMQQFGRDVPTSIKSTRTTGTSVMDNQRASLNRSNSVKSKATQSSHTQQSDVSDGLKGSNQRKKSMERKPQESVKTLKDNKGKHKKGLLHKLKKKL